MNAILGYLERHRISQKEFAEQAGVSPPMVCQWVSGKRRPCVTSALAIEKATGGKIPVSYWSKSKPKSKRRAV